MTKNRVIGIVLLILALGVLIGLFTEVQAYWLAFDYLTIAICVISGILLLKEE